MKVKSLYFEKFFEEIIKEIKSELKKVPDFKEEVFNKLHDFFGRYFSNTGSIYFKHTPFHHNIYDKIYTNDKDIVLFWKTHMLYYVKSDKLFNNLDIEIDGVKISFSVSTLEHKKANEKREIIYHFHDFINNTIHFNVFYSERGKKTKILDLLKIIKPHNEKINEDILLRAFSIFERQSEVDYFINKNSKEFLEEQFNLWLYHYVYEGDSRWTQDRISQIQLLKNFAYKIIEFVSLFENELVKIWNKPKFVLNSNYVISLNKIKEKNVDIYNKIVNHVYFKDQIVEWQELKILDDNLAVSNIKENFPNPFLPIDTRYFPDMKLDILSLFSNLDNEIDGWLIKSENYQALNTILPKFKEKIQTIYIDPPFNTGTNEFPYKTNFLDSSWMTMLYDRVLLSKELLNQEGNIFVKIDYHGNHHVRYLLNEIFGEDSYKNEIIINRTKAKQKMDKKFVIKNESLFFYSKNKENTFNVVERPIEPKWYSLLHFPRPDKKPRKLLGNEFFPPKGRRWALSQVRLTKLEEKGNIRLNKNKSYTDCNGKLINEIPEILYDSEIIDNIWLDIPGYSQKEHFPTENSEKLLQRVITVSSNENDYILDFFLGSGTTIATAQKLGRKWIGVEMASHFDSVILPRMKRVISGEKSGISKEINWKGGGFFKYYELEQYEDTLRTMSYDTSPPPANFNMKTMNQYLFLRDLKLLQAIQIDNKQDKVKLNLDSLYDSIDVHETMSNLHGKFLKSIKKDDVEFLDGTKLKVKKLDYKVIKPLIWW